MRGQQGQVCRVKRYTRRNQGRVKYVPCDKPHGESLWRIEEKVVAETPEFFKM